MAPTLKDGQRRVVSRNIRQISRGDIIAYKSAENPGGSIIFRVVGMPEERLEIVRGVVLINGTKLHEPYVAAENVSDENFGPVDIAPDEYFVMGDNRRNARDSRYQGTVRRNRVWGKWNPW